VTVPTRPETSFSRCAREQGHRPDDVELLRNTIPGLGLSDELAARWMAEGFTPWGARVWLDAGFDDPAEAHEYRRWHLGAEESFWARRDGIAATDLVWRRRLLDWMAQTPVDATWT
jgi:hypothetical protein